MDDARLKYVERQLRVTQAACLALAGALVALLITGTSTGDDRDELRAEQLVIVDEQGRERIVIGAPVPDPAGAKRISSTTGIVINDTSGYERFGLGLQETGRMIMGFDAPPGTGTGGNPERINIVANNDGTAFIRFLDQNSLLKSRLFLNDENEVLLEFLEITPDSVRRRQIGFEGADVVRQAR
jgi:hypothetical protein